MDRRRCVGALLGGAHSPGLLHGPGALSVIGKEGGSRNGRVMYADSLRKECSLHRGLHVRPGGLGVVSRPRVHSLSPKTLVVRFANIAVPQRYSRGV
jgi:hypothetical protein